MPTHHPKHGPYDVLLVDLDGTVVDSAAGIIGSLAHTFAAMGKAVPNGETLRAFVGPPILDGFQRLGGLTLPDSHAALTIYREHYLAHGLLAAPVYPGMAEFLRDAHASGRPMSLATSKPESMAHLVLDHHDLAKYFTVVTGASEDEVRSTKADVVAEALRRLVSRGARTQRTIMIGDRIHDVEGAGEHGVPTVFVTWGYGTREESRHAVARVDDAIELARHTA